MPTIAEQILTEVNALPEGTLIRAKRFLHLGSRAAVDQALTLLYDCKELMRISRGIYVRPVAGRFGIRPPITDLVLENFMATTGEMLVRPGAAEANCLGLSTQVPIQLIYLTPGRDRDFQFGALTVKLRHAPPWLMQPSHPVAGRAVRALDCIGEPGAQRALAVLQRKLPSSTLDERVALRPQLPAWMAKAITQALVGTADDEPDRAATRRQAR